MSGEDIGSLQYFFIPRSLVVEALDSSAFRQLFFIMKRKARTLKNMAPSLVANALAFLILSIVMIVGITIAIFIRLPGEKRYSVKNKWDGNERLTKTKAARESELQRSQIIVRCRMGGHIDFVFLCNV